VSQLDGWVPIGLDWSAQNPQVDWCYAGGLGFTDPFFDNTIQRAMQDPFRVLFRQKTPVEVLEERATTHPGIGPTGFIFHMSRCGSTLISQMLAASARNVVISEGWAIESVISADVRRTDITDGQRQRWLHGVIRALGQRRTSSGERYFVKFDAPHTIELKLIVEAFPDVPWIFVYREPVEVLVSLLDERPGWSFPGMSRARTVAITQDAMTNQELYVAELLARICEAALEPNGGHGLFVDYKELPDAVFGRIAAHFGCDWHEDELPAMQQATARHAKRPHTRFRADSEAKQRDADERLREIADRVLGGVYQRMEARRRQQS
jgi:hypothetical protein